MWVVLGLWWLALIGLCSLLQVRGKAVDTYHAIWGPDGTHLGTVKVPEMVSNVCFGGIKRNRLFITAQTSLYAIYLSTTGCARP